MDKKCRKILLETCAQGILNFLQGVPEKKFDATQKELLEKNGCFVTLLKNGLLRGCIGCIESDRPLIEQARESALESAFGDPRFKAVVKSELKDIKIEVSVLSKPQPVEFVSKEELLERITEKKHGVILRLGAQSATFLPSVWKQIPKKTLFLSHLCMKAGLEPTAWQEKGIRIWVYTTESFGKKFFEILPDLSEN